MSFDFYFELKNTDVEQYDYDDEFEDYVASNKF